MAVQGERPLITSRLVHHRLHVPLIKFFCLTRQSCLLWYFLLHPLTYFKNIGYFIDLFFPYFKTELFIWFISLFFILQRKRQKLNCARSPEYWSSHFFFSENVRSEKYVCMSYTHIHTKNFHFSRFRCRRKRYIIDT